MRRKQVKARYNAGSCNLQAVVASSPYTVTVCLDGLRVAGLMSAKDYWKYQDRVYKGQDFILTVGTRPFDGCKAFLYDVEKYVLRHADKHDNPVAAKLTITQSQWLRHQGISDGDVVYMKLEAVYKVGPYEYCGEFTPMEEEDVS